MPWFYGVAAAFVVIVAFWQWGKRPAYKRGVPLDGLQVSIDSFLVQMSPGSVLTAEREGGPGFLQLSLSSATAEWQSVEFGLPRTDWSTDAFEIVAARLQASGFAVEVEPVPFGKVPVFLRVSLAGPTIELGSRADQLLRLVAEALEWPRTTRFAIHASGGLRRERGPMPQRASSGPAA